MGGGEPKRECISICLQKAIKITWDMSLEEFQYRLTENAYGVVKQKEGKVFFLNFLLEVTPECDCYPRSDSPIVPDIGILASDDIVAIDQASVDLVNLAPGVPNTLLGEKIEKGVDKFRTIYPNIDYTVQIKYAEELGAGSSPYNLIEV